ncbi:MFS transporter [Streptomyces sp. NPDC058001]|uniref:MFS transporter n=1 Tax=Streptomyces sp. NPDC058001 TaxID=3346300 RepID=UPI0036E2EE4D
MTTSAQESPSDSPESTDSTEAGADPRRWLAFSVCLAAGFMVLLDGSMINVALPSVERSLDLTPTQVTWTVSGYILAFGLTLVTAGRLGDDHGRRKMFLIALVLFLISSVFCGASQNGTWLLISRIARGATAGLLNPQIVGLIQQMFSGKERGKAFGFYAATVGISTAVGPLIGGGIMELVGPSTGWRYVFYVSLPIGIATLVLATRLLPRQHVAREHAKLDLVGAALLGVAVVAIMLPVTQAGEAETEPSWWLLGVAAAGLAGFLAWERRLELGGRHPLVKLKLLKTRTYSAGALTGFCFFAAQPSIFVLCQIYFQRGMGYSPLQAAMATMSYAIGSAVAAVIGGRIVHLFGRWLIVGGSLVTTAGLGLTAMLAGSGTDGTTLPLAGALLLAGLGAGFVIAPNQTMVMSEIPRPEGGTAAGVYQTGLRVGSSIGVPLAMTLYFSTLQAHRGDVAVAVGRGLTATTAIFGVALLVSLTSVLLFGRQATSNEPPPTDRALASPSAR